MSTGETSSALSRMRALSLPITVTALMTAALLLLSMGTSLAAWMVSRSGTGAIQTGTLSFQLTDVSGTNASLAEPTSTDSPHYAFEWLTLNSRDMLPGSKSVALMRVANTGSTPLSLSFTGAVSPAGTAPQNDFVNALSLAALAVPTASCMKTQLTADVTQPLSAVTPASPLPVILPAEALQPGESTYLCVGLLLSATVPNSAQGQASDITIQARADQER
ncbi:hypothetical protein GCM10022198_23240 [Klugiella xanthotipulae]|uniref:Uncharacterized protein n=1 Tax=Klugiella xanthotipulae TaxID=244735 RepID=A0A543I5V0_9MICO|nr:hypothetical protein [Klugiella xanthotipulae]TQM65949.1 hypothetical protein FB466_0769 [Klugiella xanthotipulae]